MPMGMAIDMSVTGLPTVNNDTGATTYSTPGAFVFNCAGKSSVVVKCWAGGGGADDSGVQGGGGGGFSQKAIANGSETTITLNVGAGGPHITDGEDTTVVSAGNGTLCKAAKGICGGGLGGSGLGGQAADGIGDVKTSGGTGRQGDTGGGGGSGGPHGNGENGIDSAFDINGGGLGDAGQGDGGRGGSGSYPAVGEPDPQPAHENGFDGEAPGGGGGSGATGGAGGNGKIVVTWS